MDHERPFHHLNEEFYSGNTPSTYFRDRLTMLALRAARSDALAEASGSDGILWGQLWITSDADSNPDLPEGYEESARTRFVATESQVLFHHAVEALLRMLFAHEGSPACPWLEMVAFKDPGAFRDSVSELAQRSWSEERVNSVAEVFMGGVPAEPTVDWIERRDNAVRVVRLLAARLNQDGSLYNAAKHGLTMVGGSASLYFVPDDHAAGEPSFDPTAPSAQVINDRGIVGADGTTAVYLERKGKAKTGYTYDHVTRWFSAEEAALLTHVSLVLMDALWVVAKARHLGSNLPERIRWIDSSLFEALRHFKRGGPVQTWRHQVATQPPP